MEELTTAIYRLADAIFELINTEVEIQKQLKEIIEHAEAQRSALR